jgi:hypothetical protein
MFYSRMFRKAVTDRLYDVYVTQYYQSLLNIYPILSKSKQNQLEAVNRQIFRTIHGWYDETNKEISHLPKYKSIDNLICSAIINFHCSPFNDIKICFCCFMLSTNQIFAFFIYFSFCISVA